jgi:hypothetical protein
MDILFTGLNFWQKLAMVGSLSLIVGFVILIILFRKNIKFNLSKGEINFSDRNSLNSSDVIMEVFTRAVDTAARTTSIKLKGILSDQMNYLDEKLLLIEDILLNAFRKEFSVKTEGDNIPSHQEYLFFYSLVSLVKEEIKRDIRAIFIRNNFSSYSEQEFSDYIKEKNQWVITRVNMFLRDMYPSDKMVVSYEELEVGLKESYEKIDAILTQVFKKAVSISKNHYDSIDKMQEELEEYMTSLGIDYKPHVPQKVIVSDR